MLLRSRALSFLEHGLYLPHRPAFAGGYHAHARLSAQQSMGADLVVDGHDAEVGLGFPVERKIQVARKYLPPRPSSSSTMWLSECDRIFIGAPSSSLSISGVSARKLPASAVVSRASVMSNNGRRLDQVPHPMGTSLENGSTGGSRSCGMPVSKAKA